MLFLRLLRPLLPHIVIVGGLAAVYHVAVGIEQGSRNLIGEAIFGFGWHAVKAIAVALPVVGVVFIYVRFLRAWRRRQVSKFVAAA